MAMTKKQQETAAKALEKKHARLLELFEGDLKDQGTWRRDKAARDERYYHGEQRTKQEEAELEIKHRSPTVVNEIAPVIDRVIGNALDLDFDWQIIPLPGTAGIDDIEERAAQTYTALMDEAKDRSGIEFSFDEVKEDGLVVGRGWIEFAVENGVIKLLWVPWKDMWWDAYAQDKYMLTDARHIERAKWVPLTVALKKWPTAAKLLQAQYDEEKVPDEFAGNVFPATQDYELRADALEKPVYVDRKNKRIRVVEMWYFDGKATKDKPMGDVRLALFSKKAIMTDIPTPLKVNVLPFIPYTVKVDHNGKPYGIVRTMIDLQDVVNKRYSKAEYLLDVVQVIHAEGVVKDPEALQDQVAQPDAIIELNANAEIGKNFMIERGGKFASEQYSIFVDAVNRLREVAGTNREFMGGQTNARTGPAIRERKQASSEILSKAFRNVKRTWDSMGRLVKEFIEAYYADKRVIRITNDEGAPELLDLNGDGAALDLRNAKGKFDLKHVAIPASKDARWREMEMMANIQKTVGPGVFPPEMWIEMSNLRFKEKIIKRIRELEAARGKPSPEQEAKVRKLLADAQEAMTKGGLNQATIQDVISRAGLTKAQTEGQQVETALLIEKLEALESGMASIKTWVEGQPKAEGGE